MNVCYRGNSGRHSLAAIILPLDPEGKRTWRAASPAVVHVTRIVIAILGGGAGALSAAATWPGSPRVRVSFARRAPPLARVPRNRGY